MAPPCLLICGDGYEGIGAVFEERDKYCSIHYGSTDKILIIREVDYNG